MNCAQDSSTFSGNDLFESKINTKLIPIFKLSSFLAAVLVSQGHNNPETIVKLLKIHTKVFKSFIQKID